MLGSFELQAPFQEVRFYLLMQATKSLAEHYRAEIIDSELRDAACDSWAAPMPKRSPQLSTYGSRTSSDKSSVAELGWHNESPVGLSSCIGFPHEELTAEKCRDYVEGLVKAEVGRNHLDTSATLDSNPEASF